jgi:hypothetical protein
MTPQQYPVVSFNKVLTRLEAARSSGRDAAFYAYFCSELGLPNIDEDFYGKGLAELSKIDECTLRSIVNRWETELSDIVLEQDKVIVPDKESIANRSKAITGAYVRKTNEAESDAFALNYYLAHKDYKNDRSRIQSVFKKGEKLYQAKIDNNRN